MMTSYPDIEHLVRDLLNERIGIDPTTVGQTIIFANDIKDADEIARAINAQYGTEIALSYHSANDSKKSVTGSREKKTGLERFASSSDNIKIIVAVGKLNESVDVPTVENIVFWRGTDIAKVFLQQFGR